MRQLFLAGLILVLGAIMSACEMPGSNTVEVKEAAAGTTVNLPLGKQLAVNLKGNPTTGYNWEVLEVDSAILKQNGAADFTPDSSATGSGGQVVIRFDPVAVGQTTLKLAYRRSWEADKVPADTYQLTVNVTQ